jgi:hypothetical protein
MSISSTAGSYTLLLLTAPHDGVSPAVLLAVRDARQRVQAQVRALGCCLSLWTVKHDVLHLAVHCMLQQQGEAACSRLGSPPDAGFALLSSRRFAACIRPTLRPFT